MPPSTATQTPNADVSPPPDPAVISSNCFPVTLQFIEVCYKIKLEKTKSNIGRLLSSSSSSDPTAASNIGERTILNGITGMVSPGQILAILGPSGSGKSTLLTALAGRLQGVNDEYSLTGSILINGQKPSKQILRRTGFVSQDDILFPHLTVRETLLFCSLLRLPKHLDEREKIEAAENVITELGLSKCENTIIGNAFVRGISGGERKRVSIAQEMMVNPSLLILDEPTSGLDATAAYRLVDSLETAAKAKGRSVVMSVHQPSSRVYQMFESVLVLSEGRCIYFGKGSEAMPYFDSLGFSPSFPMNPADFLLDLANDVWLLDGAANGTERDKQLVNAKHTLVSKYNTLLGPKVKAACITTTTMTQICENRRVSKRTCEKNFLDGIHTWCNQFNILLRRSLKERKYEAFNSLRVFQVLAASILAGSMWWHSNSKDIQDRLGLLFFISIFWGVLPSFNAVFAFPQERAIFMKERASGMYTLSPYFMARIVGDLPMELILPTIFISITYWMAGLKQDFVAFVLTWMVLIGYVLVSQGLGLALGALIMDAKQASTVVTVIMLAFVLTGGFYVHKVHVCLAWMKYISTTFYCYRLLINVQYEEGRGISSLLACTHYGTEMASCKFIEEDVRGQISPSVSVMALLVMFFGYRMLAYIALRRIKA
ncbi:ABC transporter G family member 25 [Impatiens glandulifera]|uniref:ABC transporter G family member 25 n=1 Tax=Impatiens glandulifera TaxID=253017 RepID=UPI001FB09936|nr:ABC transporter G family member 25 [Impatiens glandulifera]